MRHSKGSRISGAVDPSRHKTSRIAIPSIGWPPMTMDFAVAPSVDLRTIKPGAPVNFTMQQGGDGMYVIQSVTPAGGGH
ncbi:MAG: copper-binding protein [Reyranella sp.]|nr:copper-binding protein [Reyranella sp.]